MAVDPVSLASGLLEAAPDAIVGVGHDGVIVLINAQAERLFGYARSELLGQPLELLIPESARAVHPHHRVAYMTDPEPRPMGAGTELAGRRRDGTEFPAEISLSAFETGEGLVVAAAVRDVTERKRAEQKFRGLLEAAPDAIVGVDVNGIIVLANHQAARLFGYTEAEMIGSMLDMLVPEQARARHPDHRQRYVTDPAPRPMGAGMELAGRRRDGTEFPAEISLSAIQTETGVIVSAAVRDVTERKNIEQQLREKNAELERVSRAKDTFLASMSHELRTPLNAIIGFTGTLLMQLPGPLNPDQERHLSTVDNSARHLLSIINDILDLARIESGAVSLTLEQIDLAVLVDGVASSLRPLAVEKNLRLEVTLPTEPVHVESDARALGQILINIVGNAIKFTEQGCVTVSVEAQEGRVAVRVTDTGNGIAADDLERIFEAFERAHSGPAPKEGTGLGLYISHKLSELIGAEMSVVTQQGQGTTFTISVPVWTLLSSVDVASAGR